MKSCQFLNLTTLLYEKRKNTHASLSQKRKTEKSWTLFYDRLFYNVFKMTINHFYSIGSQELFLFRKLIRSTIFTF